jgi:serine/threonine protein phosphatase PrpC
VGSGGDISPDQLYLLCTDGLTNMLPAAAMERTIAEVLGSLDATVVLVSIDRE